MSGAAALASNAVGAGLVIVALRDMLHELFHPGGTGSIGRAVRRALWGVFRRVGGGRPSVLAIAGPAILLAVILSWVVLLAVGWALVFWPYLPDGFRFASPLGAASQDGFGDALYFSLVSLTTLGLGDVTPTQPVLRILATTEAGIGFALLTAGISWVLSVYPVLSRRRALAYRASLLQAAAAETRCPVAALDAPVAAAVLGELAAALAHVRVDLVQSGITYYFHDDERSFSLPAALPFLALLAVDGLAADRPPAVRHAAAALREALSGYAETVRATYLDMPDGPLGEVLARYAADHHQKLLAPYRL